MVPLNRGRDVDGWRQRRVHGCPRPYHGRYRWARRLVPPVAAATVITGLGSGESMPSRAQVPTRFRERAVAAGNPIPRLFAHGISQERREVSFVRG